MSTRTLGTNATTSLTALFYNSSNLSADVATIANAILDDQVKKNAGVNRIWPGAFQRAGILYIPNRGFLKPLVGDMVGVDSTGWPILLSAEAIAAGPWTHT